MGVDDFGLGLLLETKQAPHIIGTEQGRTSACPAAGAGAATPGPRGSTSLRGAQGSPCSTGPYPTGSWCRREVPPSGTRRRSHGPQEPVPRGEGLSRGPLSSGASILVGLL